MGLGTQGLLVVQTKDRLDFLVDGQNKASLSILGLSSNKLANFYRNLYVMLLDESMTPEMTYESIVVQDYNAHKTVALILHVFL